MRAVRPGASHAGQSDAPDGSCAAGERAARRGAARSRRRPREYRSLRSQRAPLGDAHSLPRRKFAKGPFSALYERVAPACIDVRAGERLVRIDRHQSEYLLFQTLWALLKDRFAFPHRGPGGAFDSESVLKAWEHFPASVLRPERNRRQHLSGVLARNEVNRDYAYNRALFLRVSHGFYQLSPTLEVRRRQPEGESWVVVGLALNLRLVKEFTVEYYKPALERYPGGTGQASRSAEPPRERAEAARYHTDSSTRAAARVESESESESRRENDGCSKSLPMSPDGVPPRLAYGSWRACSCGSTSREAARRRVDERAEDHSITPRSGCSAPGVEGSSGPRRIVAFGLPAGEAQTHRSEHNLGANGRSTEAP